MCFLVLKSFYGKDNKIYEILLPDGMLSSGYYPTKKDAQKQIDFLKGKVKIKQEHLTIRELVGTETVGFRLSDWKSSYCCVKCGESLTTVCNSNSVWYCPNCKKYFNIEKGE